MKKINNTHKIVVAAIIIGAIIAGGYFLLLNNNEGGVTPIKIEGYKTYTNNEYKLSFPYPSNWSLEENKNPDFIEISGQDPSSASTKNNARLNVSAGNLGFPSLPQIGKNLIKVENYENSNLNLLTEPSAIKVENILGIGFSFTMEKQGGKVKGQQVILKGENSDYYISLIAKEDLYDNYRPIFRNIIENIKL